MKITEKAAYLKGLAEGMEIFSDPKNGKIIKGILDILEDIAVSVRALEEKNETLEDYIAEIDEDLGTLEEDFEKSRGNSHEPDEFEGYENEENTVEDESEDVEALDGVFEMKCPYCRKHIFIETDEILESDTMSVECPECGREIEIIEEDGGCSCSHCSAKHEMREDLENEETEEQ